MLTKLPADLVNGDVLTTRDLAGRRVSGTRVLSVQRIRGGVRVDTVDGVLVMETATPVEVDG